MSIHTNIRRHRILANLTQAQLASLVGVTRAMIYQWERGSSKPNLGQLRRIASLFDVSMETVADISYPPHELVCDPYPSMASIDLEYQDDRSTHMSAHEYHALVPPSIINNHPRARAVIVTTGLGSYSDSAGVCAVFDPELPPSSGSLVVMRDESNSNLLRTFELGTAAIPVHSLLGTLVWMQSARALA